MRPAALIGFGVWIIGVYYEPNIEEPAKSKAIVSDGFLALGVPKQAGEGGRLSYVVWQEKVMPIHPQIEVGNHGKIVAIDIETGDFEVANSTLLAVDKLYERNPDAQPWVIRIGHRDGFRFGSRSLRKPV